MQQRAKKGLLAAVAASGAFACAAGGVAHADSDAQGSAVGSAGVVSGNNVAVPIHVPVNVCGNQVALVGVLNPVFGNSCVNAAPPTTHRPPSKPTPRTPPPTTTPPTDSPTQQPSGTPAGTATGVAAPTVAGIQTTAPGGPWLAETGSSSTVWAPLGAAFLLGGTVLYRRARRSRA